MSTLRSKEINHCVIGHEVHIKRQIQGLNVLDELQECKRFLRHRSRVTSRKRYAIANAQGLDLWSWRTQQPPDIRHSVGVSVRS